MFEIKVEMLPCQERQTELLYWLYDNGFALYRRNVYTQEIREIKVNIFTRIHLSDQEICLCLYNGTSARKSLIIMAKLLANLGKIWSLRLNYRRDW